VKIYWISAVVGLVVLVSFQNCQKAPYQDEINSISKNVSPASASKVNLSEQRVDQVHFLSSGPQTVTNNGKTYSLIVNTTQQIELSSGKILVSSEASADVQIYCLTDALKNELLNIVKTSSVCRSSGSSAELCTQALKSPYARVITSGDQFDLGSSSDGCGSNSVDLCEDQPALLKGFAANLKAKLSTLVCN
jgi:hypothetical protein